MVVADTISLYTTLATVAATLIGLLFVAISFVINQSTTTPQRTGIEIQASGCMLCFFDVLAIALVGLSGNNVAGLLKIFGIIGLIYALASLVSLLRVKKNLRPVISQLTFIVIFGILFTLQLRSSFRITQQHMNPLQALHTFSELAIILLLVGVARTWQLIGLRNMGAISSIGTILFGERKS